MPSRAAIVRFAEYREYEANKIEANNAMMALLAASQLSAHFLKLTEGSERLLPEVFPNVAHIKRFNLKTDVATEILKTADEHLGVMGVPYVLALHEAHLKTCIELLERAGICPPGKSEKTVLADAHSVIAKATKSKYSADSLTQLTTLRKMRNCTIHAGGKASDVLIRDLARWNPTVEAAWVKLAIRNPRGLQLGQRVLFGHAEMIVALAVTKNLDRETNVMIQPAVPRTIWADMVIEDLVKSIPSALRTANPLRKARGIARHHYLALQLTDQELTDAIARA